MDNLGAVARLMANFDLPHLFLSDPNTLSFNEAAKMAVKAEHVLAGKRVVTTLEEALESTVYAVGTTSRDGVQDRPALTPEEAAKRLAHHALRGPVALVFGGEKRGLSDRELALCTELVVIPTGERQPSMNLAQAAAVLLYLCAREGVPEAPPVAPEAGAERRVLGVLEEKMRQTLSVAGFLNPQQTELILGELQRTLARAELTRREAELWVAAFRQLERSQRPKP
jgi:tRNA/rRNA methyltransferase